MKAVIQRVLNAKVTVDGKVTGEIGKGFLVLLGVDRRDGEGVCKKLAAKISKLRIFSDAEGKTNLSLFDINGSVLSVSQFTLFADCSHGNRPSFFEAAAPEKANALYELFCDELKRLGVNTQKGVFGADMKIEMTADGPFTVVLEMGEDQ